MKYKSKSSKSQEIGYLLIVISILFGAYYAYTDYYNPSTQYTSPSNPIYNPEPIYISPSPTPTPTTTSSPILSPTTTSTPAPSPSTTSSPQPTYIIDYKVIEFKSPTKSGTQITVPQNSNVDMYVTLESSSDINGNLAVEIKKDKVYSSDTTVDTISKNVDLNSGYNTIKVGSFIASDLTDSSFRQYFFKTYWNSKLIYDPTDPNYREYVKTTSSDIPSPTPTSTPPKDVPTDKIFVIDFKITDANNIEQSKYNQFVPYDIVTSLNGVAGTYTIKIDDQVVKSITVTSGNLNHYTYTFQDSGSHTICVSTSTSNTVCKDITVRVPFAEFSAQDISAPSTVNVNTDFTIKSNLKNVGTKTATLPVGLIVSNKEVATQSITINAGETKQISFTYKIPASGKYTIEILGKSTTIQVGSGSGTASFDGVTYTVNNIDGSGNKYPTVNKGDTVKVWAQFTSNGEPTIKVKTEVRKDKILVPDVSYGIMEKTISVTGGSRYYNVASFIPDESTNMFTTVRHYFVKVWVNDNLVYDPQYSPLDTNPRPYVLVN